MIDQDGVVCNKDYQVTKDIKSLVSNLEQKGVLIVPNSDTPVKRLLYNFEIMLGARASIAIGEKGAVVSINGDYFFTEKVKGIKKYINSLLRVFVNIGSEVVIGDSATWIREDKKFKANSKMLIIDGLRQQTIGFYLRVADHNGLAKIDEEWFENGREVVKGLDLPQGLKKIDYNPKYGIAISNARNTTKTTGYLFLKEIFSDFRFFMIGDENSDIINDSAVTHCAVANASNLLREKAKFISEHSFTEGLKECLEWIAEQ